ncbi:Omega-amidase NIT2 [Pseudolycoriella hygida]|uniref:omega-amidase n=1 Tax=Pseudolycoriella hygida TaxID=35572 RepID=A0A9Q0RZG1_9DIPT|nr:Omega-amidase NIT2 [Pseudolycoriella hygida]
MGICLVQMHITKSKDVNLTNAMTLIRRAVHKYDPKLVVLPEYFNYFFDKQTVEEHAEYIPNGTTYTALMNIARELRIYLVGGSIIERDEKNKHMFYNTTMVFNPTGEMIAKYRKIHLTDMEMDYDFKLMESDVLKRGHTLTMFDMDGMKIGLGIGYDLCFAELATLYRKNGCDMLIYPVVYPARLGLMQWDHLNRARAIDNQLFVVGVSPARDITKEFTCFGHSMVVDGHGRILVRGGDLEDILYTELDFMEMDKYREQIKLFGHKRTDIYDTLTKY